MVFNHKQHYNIYIFKNQKAFDLCNLTQATILTNPKTASYMIRPFKTFHLGAFFNDGSLKACQAFQNLAIKVITSVAAATTPHASAMPPAPFSDEVSPSPLFPWHYNNPLDAASPDPSPSASVTAPMVPYKSSNMPFISSNPAVPLPTDEELKLTLLLLYTLFPPLVVMNYSSLT
ncbi:hypothetical protein JHK87_050333 [Glycine soja]|nr:hypothetical protein JHK87_050333 [Glycine soja]